MADARQQLWDAWRTRQNEWWAVVEEYRDVVARFESKDPAGPDIVTINVRNYDVLTRIDDKRQEAERRLGDAWDRLCAHESERS